MMNESPWSVDRKLASEMETEILREVEAEEASIDRYLLQVYEMKQPHIGKPLILDPNHPDYNVTLVDI